MPMSAGFKAIIYYFKLGFLDKTSGAKKLGITFEEGDETLRAAFIRSGMLAYVQGKATTEAIFKKKK